jgi:hypothetical protein
VLALAVGAATIAAVFTMYSLTRSEAVRVGYAEEPAGRGSAVREPREMARRLSMELDALRHRASKLPPRLEAHYEELLSRA